MLWLLVLLRGVLEMVFWLLMGRWLLVGLAGRNASANGVVRLFDFLLRPVRFMSQLIWSGMNLLSRDGWSLGVVVLLWLVCGVFKLGWS